MGHYELPLVTSSGTFPFYVIILGSTIQVRYKGSLSTLFDTASYYGTNVTWSAVCLVDKTMVIGGDYINTTYTYFHAISGTGIVQSIVEADFKYNFATNSYDISTNFNLVVVSTAYTQTVIGMYSANNVILIQFADGGMWLCNNGVFGSYFTDSTVGTNHVLGLYYDNGAFNILHASGITQTELAASNT